MAIAVTGAEGQLGLEFCRQLGTQGVGLNRTGFDLTNPSQMKEVLYQLRPEAVINCAAYTQVDKAETDIEACRQINATAVGVLSEICDSLDCPLVQISTDYVFGVASGSGPHSEESPISPESIYAQTKAEGEQFAASTKHSVIVRTCGLYGHAATKPNFVKTMLRLGAERPQLKIVADQRCTPSYVDDVARATIHLLESRSWGLFNVVNQGETTWYEFAQEIFRQANLPVELVPITTEEYAAPAPRPRDSRLSIAKYLATGGPEPSEWQAALSEYLSKIRS